MTQENFYTEAKKWWNIFLTWNAWTWKTFIVNKFIKESSKKIVTVAFTWIAAININWSTIHSAFKLPILSKFKAIPKQKIDWNTIDILIIDEISMVWSWLVEFIDEILRKSRLIKKPFWWLQVIFIWDNKQLKPILNDVDLKKEYIDFFWWLEFFYSNAYLEWNFKKIHLTENKRTTDDKLINALNKIRDWNFDINDFQINSYDKEFENRAVHLMYENKDVDNYNNTKIFNLNWKLFRFTASVDNFRTEKFITPEILELKKGVKIMITKNLENWLCNWDIWYVLNIFSEKIDIRSDRDWKIYEILREKWDKFEYDKNWDAVSVWSFIQFPLKLAYAITITKSQWLSFDRVVFHNVSNYTGNDEIYVALSRARSYKNLFISTKKIMPFKKSRAENFINMIDREINLFKKWRKKYPLWFEVNQFNFFFHKEWIEIKYLEYENFNWKDKISTDWKIILRSDLKNNNNDYIFWFNEWLKIAKSQWFEIINDEFWWILFWFMPWETIEEKSWNLISLLNLNNRWFFHEKLRKVEDYCYYWSYKWNWKIRKRIFWSNFYHSWDVSDWDFRYSFRCFLEK